MLLQIAYTVNILILVPVALATLISNRWATLVVQSKFPVDSPFRILVGCLRTAILLCSSAGLVFPQQMLGILLLQVIYKALFLGLVIFPLFDWPTT